MSQRLCILHQNINGLINKCEELYVHLDDLANKKTVVDVLCITEHNLLKDDCPFLKIPNFALASAYFRNNRKGGSSILVRNSIRFKELLDVTNISTPDIIECCGIELIDQNVVIICIYRPPKYDKNTLGIFFNKLYDILRKYSFKKRN